MKILDSHKVQILKWTSIGLLIRLILMPFTMHSQDLFFINYFPMMFVKEGIWDPYGFIRTNFSYFYFSYYGPVFFIIMSIANFIIIKLFNPASLITMLKLSSTMMNKNFNTIDYVHAFSKLDLFKNLFLMKTPYLILDFIIAAILLKLALSKDLALKSYKFWMLNIVTLQSIYAVGGGHLIPTLFIISALYAAVKKSPYLCIILLSLGGATTLSPYILILPASLLLGNNWKNRFLLISTGFVSTVLIYLPFYFSSGYAVFDFVSLAQSNNPGLGIIKYIMAGIFIVFYLLILINAKKDSHVPKPEEKLLYYFTVILLLSYTTAIAVSVKFRYFLYVTPLLALIIPQHKKLGVFTLFIILLLALSWLTQKDLQLGLFAPVNPEYFLKIPTIQEILGRLISINTVYKITFRLLPLALWIAAWWVWRIKLNEEKV